MTLDMSKFRVVKHVTRPLIKLKEDTIYVLRFDAPMFQAEQTKNPKKDANGNPVPPPTVAHVTDAENGVASQIVCNEVLKSELEKTYPDKSYVGKWFELLKNKKSEGKTYNTFGITELELAEETPSETAQADESDSSQSGKSARHRNK